MIMSKKERTLANPTSNKIPQALARQRDSHSVSKLKPKIRFVHIFSPQIIKTDVANFRELVQRLTGRPAENNCREKQRIDIAGRDEIASARVWEKKTDLQTGFRSLKSREKMKGVEESIWQTENSGGFLGGLSDIDGLMQELGEYPFLPFDDSHSQSQAFGETTHQVA